MQNEDKNLSISEYFTNKTILLTGVTGFVGKILLEKLLRSCPHENKIYVILRSKRHHSVHERLQDLLKSSLFDTLKKIKPNFSTNVIGIAGDLLKEGLGMRHEDRLLLQKEVQIIIHSAATVRFDEPLKLALRTNLGGCAKMIDLAKQMERLEVFVHLSTAYANCHLNEIEEVVYHPLVDPYKILDSLTWINDDMMDAINPHLTNEHPNTYTFTKQLTEQLVNDFANEKEIPVVIIRPSIITGSNEEPQPGWVDNYNGPSGLIAAVSKGILRSMIGNPQAIADIIPVDIVANVILIAIWHSHCEYKEKRKENESSLLLEDKKLHRNYLKIFNCTSGQLNKFLWGQMEKDSWRYFRENPLGDCVRVPYVTFTQYKTWHSIQWLFNHQIPALFLDLMMYLMGKRPQFLKINDRLYHNLDKLQYFTNREWIFHNDNVKQLIRSMNQDDKKIFKCDVSQINWTIYIRNYFAGIGKYAFKEDPNKMDKARARLRKLQRINFLLNFILAMVTWRIVLKRIPLAHKLWAFMLQLAVRIYRCIPIIAKTQ